MGGGGWSTLDPQLRDIIERVCTPREVEALKLKHVGYGRRRMALVLGISDTAVRDRLRAAEKKIRGEVAAMRGIEPA